MTLAVVLSGGGARGAFQAGAWQQLENRVRPRFVIGASIGALNGYAMTKLTGAQMVHWWQQVLPNNLLSVKRQMQPLLEQLVALPPITDFPALAVVRGLDPVRPVIINLSAQADPLPWMQATAALPPVWPAQVIAGKRYVDGGLIEDLPVASAKAIGATRVLAIDAGSNWPLPPLEAHQLIQTPKRERFFDFSKAATNRQIRAGALTASSWLTQKSRAMLEICDENSHNRG